MLFVITFVIIIYYNEHMGFANTTTKKSKCSFLLDIEFDIAKRFGIINLSSK